MGVNSPHHVGSAWPSNEGSYNWDAELTCSGNAGLSSAFSYWDAAGRELRALLDASFEPCILALQWCWDAGFEPCVLTLRWCWFWALRLGITVVLRRRLRALRFGITWMALISLAPKVWTLLSDDMSSVIFRQFTVGDKRHHSKW